jgi:hypothetical protein
MRKRSIKITKKTEVRRADMPATVLLSPGSNETGRQRSLAETVKDWIGERDENRRAEALYSTARIFAWNSAPNPANDRTN